MFNVFDLIFPKYCLECKKRGRYLCVDCLGEPSGLRRKNGVIIIFPYKGIVRKAIWSLKYRYAYEIAKELAKLSVKELSKNLNLLPKKAILVSIPLHMKKEKQRGFNQTIKIGRILAAGFNWDFLPDLLVRKVPTRIQANLSREERLANVKGAFGFNRKYISLRRSRNLILFDDVYTTGSTMNEAKKVLTQAGFKNIFCLSVAG